jgi:hypothetical protein
LRRRLALTWINKSGPARDWLELTFLKDWPAPAAI